MGAINQRISMVVSASGLSKTAFADKINISQQYVSKLTKDGIPSDRTIGDICREFGVSEHWLRTGEGEMMAKVDADQELQDIFAEITIADDDLIKRIIKTYWQLPENEKAVIRKLVDGLVEKNTPEK